MTCARAHHQDLPEMEPATQGNYHIKPATTMTHIQCFLLPTYVNKYV